MPNQPDQVRHDRLDGFAEMALVCHSLPGAEVSVAFHDGRRFRVGPMPGCLMSPCLFRRAVGAARVDLDAVPWLRLVHDLTLTSPRCRDLGAGLYGAWCAGAAVYAFATSIELEVLVPAIEALPNCDTSVRVIPDDLLSLHLVTVESPATTACAAAIDLAREVQATVLVSELELALGAH